MPNSHTNVVLLQPFQHSEQLVADVQSVRRKLVLVSQRIDSTVAADSKLIGSVEPTALSQRRELAAKFVRLWERQMVLRTQEEELLAMVEQVFDHYFESAIGGVQ